MFSIIIVHKILLLATYAILLPPFWNVYSSWYVIIFTHLLSRYLRMYNSLTQPFSEADHVSSTFQSGFDRILCNNLEKYYSCPGFCLRLGSIMRHRNAKELLYRFPKIFLGIFASSYLAHQPVEGQILDAIYSRYGLKTGTLLTSQSCWRIVGGRGQPVLISRDMRPLLGNACNCTCITTTVFQWEPQSPPFVTRHCAGINLLHGSHD